MTDNRVLIVDDHEDSAHAMAAMLRHLGYAVTAAHTMTGALTLGTVSGAPAVLLCDVTLPDGDGCELLRRLRAFHGGREIPAVAITGHGGEWEQRCREAGYNQFLTKPVKFADVLAAVKAMAPGVT
jgi:CheY-like chemotaxis protein